MYRQPALSPVHPRMHPDAISEALAAGIAYIARRVMVSALVLTDRERDTLSELSSHEGRNRFVAISRLISILQRSARADDREALPELVRGLIAQASVETTDWRAAWALETDAQAIVDPLQLRFDWNPCRATAVPLRDGLLGQLHGTRVNLDVVQGYCQ